ncbi:hypothetical protein D9M68_594380 [compost metagenome]
MSSHTLPTGNPPASVIASRRTMNEVPTQKAESTASFAGCSTSKNTRCSSTQLSVARRLCWMGSAL